MYQILFLLCLLILLGIIIDNNIFCKKIKLKSDEVYYIENFLSQKDYRKIKKTTSDIKKNELKDESFRKVYKLENKDIEEIFYNKEQIKKIENIIKKKIYKSEFPIEYRIYPEKSSGMRCHQDTKLYEKAQYEVVYTITNDSDSFTKWYDKSCKENKIFTKPNSILIVKADTNLHCVSKLTKGSRSILKLIYTQTSNTNNNYKREMKRLI